MRQIRKIRPYLTQDTAATIVNALVTSKLDNHNGLLYGVPDYLIRRLQLVQNNAARLVTKTKKYDSITPVLKGLHWLPISFRIEYKILLLCFKILNGLAPRYMEEILAVYVPKRTLRSSAMGLLIVPKMNYKKYGYRSFSFCAPHLWNSLPMQLRDHMSVSTFKTNLKTYLFKKSFGM